MFKDIEMHLLPAKNQNLCHPFQGWVKLQLALHLLLLKILQLYHFSPPLLPPITLLDHSLNASPWKPATVLIQVLYCKIKKILNLLCFLAFVYYVCEMYYKLITTQYYIANCVSWVPRLTLLNLWTNWTYLRMWSWNRTCLYVWGLLYW